MIEYNRNAATLVVRLKIAISILINVSFFITGTTATNIEGLVNDSTTISCFTNGPVDIQWLHTSASGSSEYVYAGGNFYLPYKGRFNLDNPKRGVYILVISETLTDDAGLYECGEDSTAVRFGFFNLAVLDSAPACTSNMRPEGFIGQNNCSLQQENMTFTCAVSYSGNSVPRMTWRSLNKSHTLSDSVCLNQPKRTICSLTLRADMWFDGSVFICETTGSGHNCTSKVIKVQYLHVLAKFNDTGRTVQENVSCDVRSNLRIRYRWTLEKDCKNVFVSAEKTIVLQNPGMHHCQVEYSIRNTTCSTLVSSANTSTIPAEDDLSTGNNLMVIIIATGMTLLLVVVAVAAGFAVHYKLQKGVHESIESCPVDVKYIEEELLQNPADIKSWTISQNGGDGWASESNKRFESCFATSYEWCEKYQLIDLMALGYSASFLDSAPEILVCDWYRGRKDCGGFYRLHIELQNDSQVVLQKPFEFEDKTETSWSTVTNRFSNYGKGLRFVKFQHSGKDDKWWKGHFGTKVAGSSVIFLFPTVQQKVSKCSHRPIATVPRCEDISENQAIRKLISLWNLSTIDQKRVFKTSIRELNQKFKKDILSSRFGDVPQIETLQIDHQWVSDDSACITVLLSQKTRASIIVPIGRQFGAHLFKTLLTRSFQFCETIEFRRNDGGITVSDDSIIFKKHKSDTSWIVLLHGSNAKMIGICNSLKHAIKYTKGQPVLISSVQIPL